METPVGNPNVSLLPQPAVPAPIEPMRGGGGGDGTENISLLPQPTVPAPIEPMRGGGLTPLLTLEEFRPGAIPSIEDVKKTHQLHKKDLIAYNSHRKDETWAEISPPLQFTGTGVQEKIRKMSLIRKITMDPDTKLYIYHVSSLEQFLQIEAKIQNKISTIERTTSDEIPIFVIVNAKSPPTEFSEILRRFLKFAVSGKESILGGKSTVIDNKDYQIYFLFDKSNPSNEIDWDTKKETAARTSFYYLEPDTIEIDFPVGDKQRSFLIVPGRTVPSDFQDDYVALGSDPTLPDKLGFETRSNKQGLKAKQIRDLEVKTIYTIDTNWGTHRVIVSFSDRPEEGEEADGEEDEAAAVSAATPAATPAQVPQAEAVATPPPPKRVFEIKTKDTMPIDLGSYIFQVRKPTFEAQAAWKSGEYTEEEIRLFETLGMNKAFQDSVKGLTNPAPDSLEDRKLKVLAQRAELMRILTLSNCVNDTAFLLNSECQWLRDYLQELLEIRQLERLGTMTSFLSNIDDFTIQLKQDKLSPVQDPQWKQGRAAIEGVDKLLRQLTTKLTPKIKNKPVGVAAPVI